MPPDVVGEPVGLHPGDGLVNLGESRVGVRLREAQTVKEAEHELRHKQVGLVGRSLWPEFCHGEKLEGDQACQITLMQVPCILHHDVLLPLILGKLEDILQSLPGWEDFLSSRVKVEGRDNQFGDIKNVFPRLDFLVVSEEPGV